MRTVELVEKYNNLLEISSSYIKYRNDVRSDKVKPDNFVDRVRQSWAFVKAGHQRLYSPLVGESLIETEIISGQVKEIYKSDKYYRIYVSKHPLAALSDHVFLEMDGCDFLALQKLHQKRQKFLTSFDRVPFKIGAVLFASKKFAVTWVLSAVLSLFAISEIEYKSYVEIIFVVCLMLVALVFSYFLFASVRTSSARSIVGEVLDYINMHSKQQLSKHV